jgi:hypothetical protein
MTPSTASFNPFKRVTRGQIAAFINRLDGKREIPDGDPVDFFTDDGKLHEADINAVVAKGIMQGGGDGRFRPNAAITPGAMAAVLSRYVQLRAQ